MDESGWIVVMSGYEATAIGLIRAGNFFGPQGITLAEKTGNKFIKSSPAL